MATSSGVRCADPLHDDDDCDNAIDGNWRSFYTDRSTGEGMTIEIDLRRQYRSVYGRQIIYLTSHIYLSCKIIFPTRKKLSLVVGRMCNLSYDYSVDCSNHVCVCVGGGGVRWV